VDLPTDCDDEYWENDDPNLAFKQPPGKPSKVAFFISLIKQQEILALALRTIVGSSRVHVSSLVPYAEDTSTVLHQQKQGSARIREAGMGATRCVRVGQCVESVVRLSSRPSYASHNLLTLALTSR
jgi:hypothetical protein